MASREWPLVVFTLLAQIGVGIFLAFVLPIALATRGLDGPDAGPVLFRALLFVFALIAAAGAVSFFHLGKPWNAYRTLTNLKTSWLSREILFELLFVGILVLLVALEWGRRGGRAAPVWLYILGGLAGAALVLSMSNIYRLESVPSWNRAMTPVSFFLTVLAAGSVAAIALPVTGLFGPVEGLFPNPGILRACGIALVSFEVATTSLFDPNFGLLGILSPLLRVRQSAVLKALFAFRLALLGLAVVLLIFSGSGGAPARRGSELIWAFAAVLVSEGIGRTLFFAAFRKDGV